MIGRAGVVIVLSLALARPAVGEQKGPAAKAFAKGMELYRKADYEAAIEAFNHSYQLHPHFLTLCNIARAYERWSDMVRAAQHYRRCLKEGGERSPKAGEIQSALQAVESQVGSLTVESPGTPPAEAFVDGAPIGNTPAKTLVNPGPHTIEVRRPNARPQKSTVQVEIGEHRTVVLQTVPSSPQPPAGGQPVVPEQPRPTRRERGLSTTWFWSALGLTAALAVTATALGIKTLVANSDYEDKPTEDGYNQVIDYKLYTNIFWGLTAGAAGATTLLFFYTDFRAGERNSDEQAFVIGVQGRF